MYNAFYYAACIVVAVGTVAAGGFGIIFGCAWAVRYGAEKGLWKKESWK